MSSFLLHLPTFTWVPQGSHCGLLFNVFITNIGKVLNGVNNLLFTSDLKLFKHTFKGFWYAVKGESVV